MKNCSEIEPGLYLGSASAIGDESRRLGISAIIRVHGELPSDAQRSLIGEVSDSFCWVVAHDHPHTNIRCVFERTTDYIVWARRRGAHVLVCCGAGVSRSASLVIGYLMSTRNIDGEAALQLVNEKRSVQPNSGFLRQILDSSVEDAFFPDIARDAYYFNAQHVVCILRHSIRLDDAEVNGDWPDRHTRPYDTPLAHGGAQLAQETMSRVGVSFNKVICSPFRRCLQTVVPLEVESVVIDRSIGELMSRVQSEMKSFPGAQWSELEPCEIDATLGASCSWSLVGETPPLEEPPASSRRFLECVAGCQAGSNTLLVTHGDAINAATEGICGRVCYSTDYCACVVIDLVSKTVLYSSGCKFLL